MQVTLPPRPPIDMVLHCPNCGKQHIDAAIDPDWPSMPDGPTSETPPEEVAERAQAVETWKAAQWLNPPHRSHLCHGCGHIWRPADVPTNGVEAVKSKGVNDSPIVRPGVPTLEWKRQP